MRSLLPLILTTLFLLFFACKTTKDTSDLSKLNKVMEMYKSPCFGKCPVFRLTIYENGFASFHGQLNTDKQGIYVRQLSKPVFKELCNEFKKAQLDQYKDHYPSDLSDLPKVTIGYFHKDIHKSIMGDINLPEAVKALEKKMDEIADADGWILREGPVQEEKIIRNELIVQFKKEVDIPDWIYGMEKYGAELIRELGPKSNRWLIRFDVNKMDPTKMLETVKRSEGVIEASFNKKLQTRNR